MNNEYKLPLTFVWLWFVFKMKIVVRYSLCLFSFYSIWFNFLRICMRGELRAHLTAEPKRNEKKRKYTSDSKQKQSTKNSFFFFFSFVCLYVVALESWCRYEIYAYFKHIKQPPSIFYVFFSLQNSTN